MPKAKKLKQTKTTKKQVRKPKKAKGVPKETLEENCLADVEKAVRKQFKKESFKKPKNLPSKQNQPFDLQTTFSANGYFEATMSQQVEIVARVLCEMLDDHELLIEALAASPVEKVRGIAAAVVLEAFSKKLAQAIKWLQYTGSLAGTWPRELSQGYLHHLTNIFGVNTVLPKVKGFVQSEDEAIRRLVIEGLRPKGVMLGHITELKENPLPLRALLEAVLDDTSEYVRKAAGNNLNDIAAFHADTVVKWCTSWLKPSSSEERKFIIERGLRNLLKNGHPEALRLLGFTDPTVLTIEWLDTMPKQVEINELIAFDINLHNNSNIEARVQILLKLDEPGKSGRRLSQYQIYKGWIKKGNDKNISKTIHFVDKNSAPRIHGEYRAKLVVNGKPIDERSFEYS